MRLWRLGLLAIVALGLAPGTWVRTLPSAPGDAPLMLRVIRLGATTPADWPEGLGVAGLWQIDGDHPEFGGFSAMLADDRLDGADAGFTLYSDVGRSLRLPRAGLAGPIGAPVDYGPLRFAKGPFHSQIRQVFDIESATRDPERGTIWLAYEHHNAIQRIDSAGGLALARPVQMAGLGANSGIEAMVRLDDGRFVVLAERAGFGLVFAGDPVAEARAGRPARVFPVESQGAYLPTDMAQMPDGRVLVLLRDTRLQVPPFASMLAIGDPADIREGEVWPLARLAQFDEAPLRENYEALAVEQEKDGRIAIWLMSDDNLSAFQRSLMLKLRWDGAMAAPRQ